MSVTLAEGRRLCYPLSGLWHRLMMTCCVQSGHIVTLSLLGYQPASQAIPASNVVRQVFVGPGSFSHHPGACGTQIAPLEYQYTVAEHTRGSAANAASRGGHGPNVYQSVITHRCVKNYREEEIWHVALVLTD